MSFLIVRNDLSVVEAEFIRPREWIKSLGLVKGARIDLAVPELEIDGLAEVTAVRDCPPIAEGEGRVVTGRFVTRDVANVVRIKLASGSEIRATDVHPVWSVDREDWVPAGKLEPGEMVDTLAGPVAVASVETLDRHPAVYNLEVHGEHVYRIAVDGVLVHNAGPGNYISASRIQGLLNLYPQVIDPRTGLRIPFPSSVRSIASKAERVAWGAEERAAFISDWYRRGFSTPRGGWGQFDIHHIHPREFGSMNDFWNLVPVERSNHQELFNAFWREFTRL